MYEIELLALTATATIFALMTFAAKNFISQLVYRFATLFTIIALVSVAISAAGTYNFSTGVFSAILFLCVVVIIFEVLLIVVYIFLPSAFAATNKKFRFFNGEEK